ncbi:hypothetical protein FE840_001400 [Peteryoungia desertarenae]|uniref:Uncharacterized protein n=1 Tax=Peteryoungia desertarenae TaxID=1813451 RepID=A0ABX6QIH1_9HYPH|nr:hypothetical protein [Peteryoungia desertarenae]QLF68315.1 hypothetical protein FE840_001400 [Peteryoungia desertarenae]
MAIFDRLDRMTSRQVDRSFSVAAVIDPMKKTANGRPVPDPSRSEVHLRGILEIEPITQPVEIGKRVRSGNDLMNLVNGSLISFSFDVRRWPSVDEIRQGDRLQLDDLRRFEVISVERDGLSRAVLRLVEV